MAEAADQYHRLAQYLRRAAAMVARLSAVNLKFLSVVVARPS
jgi:hypothetical protein